MNNKFNYTIKENRNLIKDFSKYSDNFYYSRLSSADRQRQNLSQTLKRNSNIHIYEKENQKKNENHSYRISRDKKPGLISKKSSEIPMNSSRQITVPISKKGIKNKKKTNTFVSNHTDFANITPGQICNINSNAYNQSPSKFVLQTNSNNNVNKENTQLKKIIKIMSFYIENLNKEIKNTPFKNIFEKKEKIKKLEQQNDFLLNENRQLKLTILNIFQLVKKYDDDEIKRQKKYQKFISQLIQENIYLRKANIKTCGIVASNLFIKTKKENQKNDEIINNEQIKNNNIPVSNIIVSNNNESEINSNPFNNYNIAKGMHKKQKTHFNLSNPNNSDSNYSNNTSSAEGTDVNTNYFDDTLKSMKNNLNNSRKNSSSKRNILNEEQKKVELNSSKLNLGTKESFNNKYYSPTRAQLFYRTPKGSEKKELKFTH